MTPPKISKPLTCDFVLILRLPTGTPAKRQQAVAIVHLFGNVDSLMTLIFVRREQSSPAKFSGSRLVQRRHHFLERHISWFPDSVN
jgi:hypothetical protein